MSSKTVSAIASNFVPSVKLSSQNMQINHVDNPPFDKKCFGIGAATVAFKQN